MYLPCYATVTLAYNEQPRPTHDFLPGLDESPDGSIDEAWVAANQQQTSVLDEREAPPVGREDFRTHIISRLRDRHRSMPRFTRRPKRFSTPRWDGATIPSPPSPDQGIFFPRSMHGIVTTFNEPGKSSSRHSPPTRPAPIRRALEHRFSYVNTCLACPVRVTVFAFFHAGQQSCPASRNAGI